MRRRVCRAFFRYAGILAALCGPRCQQFACGQTVVALIEDRQTSAGAVQNAMPSLIDSAAAAGISGTVRDVLGAPVSAPHVTLLNLDNTPAAVTRADAHGAFVFSGIEAGIYHL